MIEVDKSPYSTRNHPPSSSQMIHPHLRFLRPRNLVFIVALSAIGLLWTQVSMWTSVPPDDVLLSSQVQVIALQGFSSTRRRQLGTSKSPVSPHQTTHDFRSGPRPIRVVAGYSRAELERGDKVKFQTSENGVTLKMDSSSASKSALSFAGLVKGAQTDSYAASWLTTTETLINNDDISETLLIEASSFDLEEGHFAMAKPNTEYQSVDMFDFFVHHLSKYQRLVRRSELLSEDIIKFLQRMERGYEEHNFYNNPSKITNGQTLAILPFFAASEGGTRTSLQERRGFLNVTVKTVSAVFPNIAVFVTNVADFKYVTEQSGLNEYLYDVHFIKDLPDPEYLPYGSSVKAKSLIQNRTYTGFDFIFYTETDQIPHLRDVDLLLHTTLQSKDIVVIPHRGDPVGLSEDVSNETYQNHKEKYDWLRLNGERVVHDVPNLMDASCCFRRDAQPLVSGQPYINLTDTRVHVFRQHESMAFIAGTGNNMKRIFHVCELRSPRTMCL